VFRMNLKTAHGLSIIEMLYTLAIISILSMGAAHTQAMLSKQRLYDSQSNLHLLIRRARHDALISRTRITVCALSVTGTCKQDWSGSISAFTDHNGNRQLDTNEVELSKLDFHPNLILDWKGMKPTNSIHFSPIGVTFVSNGTFTLCSPHHKETVKLVINKQGRTRSELTSQACKSRSTTQPDN
jgi:type IV fimbrial biogenesis protein FimT